MSVICTHQTRQSDSIAISLTREADQNTTRTGILLADPQSLGHIVALPPVECDQQAAIDAIYAHTPFIPILQATDERTRYDTVDEFLQQHPKSETVSPLLDRYFSHSA
jgi:hypothetical protein